MRKRRPGKWLEAMADAIAAYEAELGEISAEELEAQRRADKLATVHPKRRSA